MPELKAQSLFLNWKGKTWVGNGAIGLKQHALEARTVRQVWYRSKWFFCLIVTWFKVDHFAVVYSSESEDHEFQFVILSHLKLMQRIICEKQSFHKAIQVQIWLTYSEGIVCCRRWSCFRSGRLNNWCTHHPWCWKTLEGKSSWAFWSKLCWVWSAQALQERHNLDLPDTFHLFSSKSCCIRTTGGQIWIASQFESPRVFAP